MKLTPFHFLRNCRAFTLIELLTVIAIIGILAAIIIPTVGKVRKSSRRAECVSNLRQIVAAAHLFANDNKNNFPTTNDATQGIGPTPAPPTHDGGLITALLSYAGENKKIFYCSDNEDINKTYTFTNQQARDPAWWNIGYYWYVSRSGILTTKPPFPQSASGDPRRILISCPYNYSQPWPHNGKSYNAGYADGHVSLASNTMDRFMENAGATLLPK